MNVHSQSPWTTDVELPAGLSIFYSPVAYQQSFIRMIKMEISHLLRATSLSLHIANMRRTFCAMTLTQFCVHSPHLTMATHRSSIITHIGVEVPSGHFDMGHFTPWFIKIHTREHGMVLYSLPKVISHTYMLKTAANTKSLTYLPYSSVERLYSKTPVNQCAILFSWHLMLFTNPLNKLCLWTLVLLSESSFIWDLK